MKQGPQAARREMFARCVKAELGQISRHGCVEDVAGLRGESGDGGSRTRAGIPTAWSQRLAVPHESPTSGSVSSDQLVAGVQEALAAKEAAI